MDGLLAGERVNKSLKIPDWIRAGEIVRDWEIEGTIQQKREGQISIGDACHAFLTDAEARHLSKASLKKYRVLLISKHDAEERETFSPSLLEFCAERDLQFTNQIGLPALCDFRAQWKDGPLSGAKKLERLRAVGRFFVDRGWWRRESGTQAQAS